MGGMYSTSHLDDGIEWFTGNTREASSNYNLSTASVVALFLMALLSFDTAGE